MSTCAVPGCAHSLPCPWHSGPALRDRAFTRVARVDPAWIERAWTLVELLAQTGREFTPDDVWAAGLDRPQEPRALGPVMMRAAKAGLIVPTGRWVQSRQASQHATPVREWKGATR